MLVNSPDLDRRGNMPVGRRRTSSAPRPAVKEMWPQAEDSGP
jgi:hypothetical protein